MGQSFAKPSLVLNVDRGGSRLAEKPYISFVVVARNDNYGGDFLHRVNVFVKCLLYMCEAHCLDSELIIVEWNPPDNQKPLTDAIIWPDIEWKHTRVRTVKVLREVHNALENPAGLNLFEYLGKNVGVRRARGEYVLVTNPDVIFGKELIRWLASRTLAPNVFCRIDRYDVRTPIPLDNSPQDILEYCERNALRTFTRLGVYDIGKRPTIYRRVRFLLSYAKHFPNGPLHFNASGDFFLMHSSSWNRIRGYPELERLGKSHHIDSLLVLQAHQWGYRQLIIKPPAKLYHQDHGRVDPDKPKSMAVAAAFADLKRSRKPIYFNPSTWGLSDKKLPEEELARTWGNIFL